MISVRHYMIDANWNQADLAKALGVTVSQVSLMLSGKRNPSFHSLRKLNAITGISIDTLAQEAGKKPPRKKPIPKVNGS